MEQTLSQTRILIVDDDDYLRAVLLDQLRREDVGYLQDADCASKVIDLVDVFAPDLILLDVQMPDGNGFDLCAELRRRGFLRPIIMLTGQTDEADAIKRLEAGKALEAGANDYVRKPLRIAELLARIRTQLRQFKASDAMRFVLGELDFVPANKSLIHRASSQHVSLTEKETLILKNLVRARPDSVTKEAFLRDVWGVSSEGVSTHTLETHIYRLRQKLQRAAFDTMIETTKTGYRLTI